MNSYNAAFYDHQMDESLSSARIVLPLLFELYRPISVVDVGCGVGTWLSVCRELGVSSIWGLDGEYVARRALKIPLECFCPSDLSKPFSMGRRFDLAMSLEVAEHLSPERASTFIVDLTALSDVVLFSAAVPYQGGTGHVNENWPEYWAALFRTQGYRVVDFLRPQIWGDGRIGIWYRQNLLVFVKQGCVAEANFADVRADWPLSVVHPELFLYACHRVAERGAPATAYDFDKRHYAVTQGKWARGEVPGIANQPGYGREFPVNFNWHSVPLRLAHKAARQLYRWLTSL